MSTVKDMRLLTHQLAAFVPYEGGFRAHALHIRAKNLDNRIEQENPEDTLHAALTEALAAGVSPTTVFLLLDDVVCERDTVQAEAAA